MLRQVAITSLAVLVIAMPAHAQDKTAQIDSIFSFATPTTPGCAVGVSQGGNVVANVPTASPTSSVAFH
jgi:hypothetical protein